MKYNRSSKLGCFIVLSVVALILLVSCTNSKLSNEEGKINIAVSILPEYTFVKAVCGDTVNVITAIPKGVSPANYEPTPVEQTNLETSKIYFSIGVPTEFINIIPMLQSNTKIVSLYDKVSNQYDDLKINGKRDPHIWLSPKRVIAIIEIIQEEMSTLIPQNAELYRKNANNYIGKLKLLDSKVKFDLKNLKDKYVIVYHPSFAYLCDDYNLKMYAIEENGKEPSPKYKASLIDFAKKNNIKSVFYQAEIDEMQPKSFAEDIGGKSYKLFPLSENYIENYKSMIKTIKEAIK